MNAVTPVIESSLGFLDWRIVEMARKDGPRSLNPDGVVARVARRLGANVPFGLANERQEALRRFSVRAWHWDLIRTKDVRAFVGAGYSRAQLLDILSHVGLSRGFVPTIEDDAEHPSLRNHSSRCHCG